MIVTAYDGFVGQTIRFSFLSDCATCEVFALSIVVCLQSVQKARSKMTREMEELRESMQSKDDVIRCVCVLLFYGVVGYMKCIRF